MNPSETTISGRINALDPARFQLLAEQFVCSRYAKRFQNLQRRGRNAQGDTVAGWPDAYELLPDGHVDVLEVTRARNWKKHLEADLRKATSFGGGISGFVFVAWARTPDPKFLSGFQAKLRAIGGSGDCTAFIFRD